MMAEMSVLWHQRLDTDHIRKQTGKKLEGMMAEMSVFVASTVRY